MNKDFQKAIYTRTKLKSKYCEIHLEKNLCVSIRRRSITNYLNKFSNKGLQTNKSFSKFIKPFLTHEGNLTDCAIAIADGKKVISNDFELAKTFSNHYIHTDEINSGFKPLKTTNKSKVQLSVEILSTPLSTAINNFLKYGVFPDNAKITLAIPLDKVKPSKNEISNFRPVAKYTKYFF